MREKLELLREMGVKFAAFSEGELSSVEFFPPELPPLGASDTEPPSPMESAYEQAVNAVRGVRADGHS
jgi:hypothetical protein